MAAPFDDSQHRHSMYRIDIHIGYAIGQIFQYFRTKPEPIKQAYVPLSERAWPAGNELDVAAENVKHLDRLVAQMKNGERVNRRLTREEEWMVVLKARNAYQGVLDKFGNLAEKK